METMKEQDLRATKHLKTILTEDLDYHQSKLNEKKTKKTKRHTNDLGRSNG